MRFYIETDRLILRDLLPVDDRGIFELDSDPDVHRYLGRKPIKTIDQAREVIQLVNRQYDEQGIGRWAMVEKDSGSFIGWAGLKLVKETVNGHTGFHDLGYRLIKRYWSNGYAAEAALAAVKYAFDTMKLDKINAFTDINNTASRRVLKKTGMQFIETFMHEGDEHAWYEMQQPLL